MHGMTRLVESRRILARALIASVLLGAFSESLAQEPPSDPMGPSLLSVWSDVPEPGLWAKAVQYFTGPSADFLESTSKTVSMTGQVRTTQKGQDLAVPGVGVCLVLFPAGTSVEMVKREDGTFTYKGRNWQRGRLATTDKGGNFSYAGVPFSDRVAGLLEVYWGHQPGNIKQLVYLQPARIVHMPTRAAGDLYVLDPPAILK